MKKFALLAGLFVFAPMTWAQDYNIKKRFAVRNLYYLRRSQRNGKN